MSESGHHTETLEENVRKEPPESYTDEQRKSWNQNNLRLIEKRTLEHQVPKKSQRTRIVPMKKNSPIRKI